MGHPHRETMVTIRVDPCLGQMLKSIPNRSAFIRGAIIEALARQRPASGVLAAADRAHRGNAPEKQAGRQAADET